MKNKVFHLSTCKTCQRIIEELNLEQYDFEIQDIKSNHITEAELDEFYQQTQSYEQLFNKRAQKYRKLGLKEQNLSDEEFKPYILEEYTFLKRPAIMYQGKAYLGNSKKVVQALKEALENGK